MFLDQLPLKPNSPYLVALFRHSNAKARPPIGWCRFLFVSLSIVDERTYGNFEDLTVFTSPSAEMSNLEVVPRHLAKCSLVLREKGPEAFLILTASSWVDNVHHGTVHCPVPRHSLNNPRV